MSWRAKSPSTRSVLVSPARRQWTALNQYSQYCLVLDDRFSELDASTWNAEVQLNGYGNGAFDWTTADDTNYFADSEGLHITPTLTNETTPITNAQIYDGFTLDLLSNTSEYGRCTGTTETECVVHSSRADKEIIPPVRSARINTKGKKSIRYGRVEVVAKLPRGDWLWPAICETGLLSHCVSPCFRG